MRTIRFLLTLLILAIPAAMFGQIGISVRFGPPMLPIYEQPMCPGEGYLWTPGYWAYNENVSDYYWVPGTWVMAPQVGFLWTPGYWGYRGGGYYFNEGYWGQTVGFYGGVRYGYGYYGEGYRGGRWDHDHFYYNRSESRVDERNFHHVYEERVERGRESRVSFNGGNGGIELRATPQQEAAGRERHIAPIAVQHEHEQTARERPELRALANHGKPPISATSRPGEFGEHAAPAKPMAEANKPGGGGEPNKNVAGEPNKNAGGEPNKGAGGEANVPHAPVHPKDFPPIARPAPVNSGNAKADKQYEQKQDQMIAKQTQQRQALQQKQDAEHQRNVNANAQQLEQKHQQQTQQMAQRHEAQQKQMQTHQPQNHKPTNNPPPPPPPK